MIATPAMVSQIAFRLCLAVLPLSSSSAHPCCRRVWWMAFDVLLLLWASGMVLLLLMLYFMIAIAVNHVTTAVRHSVCHDCHSCHCVAIAIAIVQSHSDCCCCDVPVALGGKDVIVTKMLIENVMMSLLTFKYC